MPGFAGIRLSVALAVTIQKRTANKRSSTLIPQHRFKTQHTRPLAVWRSGSPTLRTGHTPVFISVYERGLAVELLCHGS